MTAIDLCCGAGGLTNGLRRAGWDVVAGIDVDDAVGLTYRRNNPTSRFVHADLRRITDQDVRALASGVPSRELLLAGCAPCQAFSKQRGRSGLQRRSDATLLWEFGRLVVALRPRAVLMENVPGIAAVPGSAPSGASPGPCTTAATTTSTAFSTHRTSACLSIVGDAFSWPYLTCLHSCRSRSVRAAVTVTPPCGARLRVFPPSTRGRRTPTFPITEPPYCRH